MTAPPLRAEGKMKETRAAPRSVAGREFLGWTDCPRRPALSIAFCPPATFLTWIASLISFPKAPLLSFRSRLVWYGDYRQLESMSGACHWISYCGAAFAFCVSAL